MSDTRARSQATPLAIAEPTRAMLMEIAGDLLGAHGSVAVETMADGDAVFFILRVPAADLGRFIGPSGRTAQSLRVIVSAAGLKLARRFSLSIASPPDERSAPGPYELC